MKTRRGVSLVELTVVMSACTVVLTLSAVLMHRAMRSYTQATACQDAERSAMRLSEQFRRDVHQARAASIDPAALGKDVFLRLDLSDDQAIAYRDAAGHILRVLSQGETTISREEYALSPSCRVNIEETAAPRRITLAITTDPTERPARDARRPLAMEAVPVNLQVAAVLGREVRHTAAAVAQENPQ